MRVGASRAHAAPAVLIGGAKVAGGAAMVAMNLWLASRLSPAAFGVFALATTGLLLLDGVFGSALDAAVIRTTGDSQPRALSDAERAGLVLKVAAGAGLGVLAAGTAWLLEGRTTAVIVMLAAAGGTGLLVHRSALLYFQLRTRFASYALVDLVHTTTRWLLVALVLSAGYLSAAAMIGAYAVAPWLVAGAACVVCGWAGSGARVRLSSVKSVIGVAGWTLATTALGAVVARLDVLLLGAVAGSREAGIFAAAATLALVPTWLGAYLAPAFSGYILRYGREGRLLRFLGEVQAALIALAVIGTAAGVLLAPLAARTLLPAEYAGAAPVLAILLVAGAAGFVTFPLVLHTLLFLSPRTYLVMDLVSLPILIPLYVVAARRSGAAGVAWVTAGATVIKACIAQVAAAAVARRADGADTTLTSGPDEAWAPQVAASGE